MRFKSWDLHHALADQIKVSDYARETSIVRNHAFSWVSPFPPDACRGGWRAMQFHLLRALEERLGTAVRIAPVDVPEDLLAKWLSRVQKKVRIPRSFSYYSEARLKEFAVMVDSQLPDSATKPVIFFGALPFARCCPMGPYFVYTDSSFAIHYYEYNLDHTHAQSEIDRICQAEATFLRGAEAVFVSSCWAAERIHHDYEIPLSKFEVVGTGPGAVPSPVEPIQYGDFVVMVAADFDRKDGRFAADVIGVLNESGLNLRIKFVGEKPPKDVFTREYVDWCGWLNLNRSEDRSRFANLMSTCAAHILPSKRDLSPLAIVEAATFSKATIARSVGGIPEMVNHGETGIVFGANQSYREVAAEIIPLLRSPDGLRRMGERARIEQRRFWDWRVISGKIEMAFRRHCPHNTWRNYSVS